MRHSLLRTFAAALVLWGLCGTALAQERQSVSGRSRPVVTGNVTERADWCVTFGGAVLAGGDLFRVINDLTVTWTAPAGETGTFEAARFTATLDEDAALAFGVGRRLGDRSWLRLDLAAGELDVSALANDTQFVTPVLYDRLSMTLASLSWEQRLLDTRLQPYLALGASWIDVDGASAALTQTRYGARVAAGLSYRFLDMGGARLEVADHIVSLDSESIGDEFGHPESARYTENGPQHLFALSLQLELMF